MGTAWLSQVPLLTVDLPAMDSDPGTWRHTHQRACRLTGFQDMKPLALCDDEHFGAQHLHLRYGRQSAIPLASSGSLPPRTQDSVLTWWLAFGQAGLPS